MFSPKFTELVQALRCLPSVGHKSAQRMALHLLERDRKGAMALSQIIEQALKVIGRCDQCRILTESSRCSVCLDSTRNIKQLCIVESPTDWIAIEQSGAYEGLYFLLTGRLSPLDGIGPNEIGINELKKRLEHSPVEEIIIAISATLEGAATTTYIMDMLKNQPYKITRLAQGIPMGGELEYLDSHTLSLALKSRREIED
ncbi:MAG: recombination protein RecR [Halothiobacillus sp. 24-54-40]|jgi:recombination protein RecR|nr:recombination protein RecR [Halothiobacillaceae bacterium]OYV47101.1 MAG: recombination protein RecR [Halothiobacillus sp. 20-53-49]OYY40376.1 MAG: recombination protein RecR [Halothiobacillus sp. 35-54-62]OYZ86771.1 MAG: recombination protein RecR [Halothiobacillus sp. 24-54-40]OZA79040.1 MAG: recombination protein RecR [Halothiobacillus sp. 39-53-45]HQS02734.1 recombination mediator RecR [Halothiobacillus sp.]